MYLRGSEKRKKFFSFPLSSVLTCLGLVIILTPSLLSAQTAVFADILPCMELTDDTARLACYDGLGAEAASVRIRRLTRSNQTASEPVTVPRSSSPAPDTVVVPAIPLATTPPATLPAEPAVAVEEEAGIKNRVEDFGIQDARIVENEDGEEELIDRIASLRQREPNKWLITLASGQVWYQANSKRFRLREGMEVRIYRAPFNGSYRLSATDINGFIQVTRVQ